MMHQLETDRTQVPTRRDKLNINQNKNNNYYDSHNGGGSVIKPVSSGSSNIVITPATAYESSSDLWGCTPLQVVSVIKFLVIIVAIGAAIGILLSSLGAGQGGSAWMGEQPGETFILFIINIVWSCLILFLTCFILYNLYKQQFSLGIKLEIDLCLVLAFLACSLAGGIIVSTIDQTSAISYPCSQVYSKIWPDTLLGASQTASENLCTSACPCNYSTTSQADYAMNGVYSASGPVSAVGCSSYSPLSSEVLAKLKSMETTWKCAGICEVSNKYLFSDVNRGLPNQAKSCFTIASQKLYPIRNYFLVGDFTISIIQTIALIMLLCMKKFLAREDVRFAHNSVPLEQEKQQLFKSNLYGNANNPSMNPDNDRSVLAQKQRNDQSIVYDEPKKLNNNNTKPVVVVLPAESQQPQPNKALIFEQNPRPLAQFVEQNRPIQAIKEPAPLYVSQPKPIPQSKQYQPPVERVREIEPIIEYETPRPPEPQPITVRKEPVKSTQVLPEQPNRINNQFSDLQDQQQRDQDKKLSKNPVSSNGKPFLDQKSQEFDIPIIDSGVPSKQQKGQPHQLYSAAEPAKTNNFVKPYGESPSIPSPPLIDSGVPSQAKKPQSHLLSNPNTYSKLANSGNAVLTTPRSVGPNQSQPPSTRSFLDGLQQDNPGSSRLPSTTSQDSKAPSLAGKKFFKQNNSGQDKLDI